MQLKLNKYVQQYINLKKLSVTLKKIKLRTMIALITGATAGIGEATAKVLAKNNYDLIITGRRFERLKSLKILLEKEYSIKVKILNFDVRNRTDVEKNIQELSDDWKQVDLLINNAGLASGLELIQDGDVNKWEQMIDTNVKGLLYVSRQIMPIMVERKKGHIVNIGSIAGKEVYMKGNVYCATKHAVDALTKAMRMELVPHGVVVSQIAPGMVETEFSIVRLQDDEKAKEVYAGFEPLTAKDIADTVEFIISRPKNVNINDILIMPAAQANSYITQRD